MSAAGATSMYGSRLVAVSLAFVLLATADCAAYTYGGSPWGAAALIASVVSLGAWLTTTLRRPPGAPAAFTLYVATLTAMLLLEAEEWYQHMPVRLMHLYPGAFPEGVGISDHAFIAVFPLAGSAVLVLGALLYFHGAVLGRFAAWLTFAWGATAGLSVYVFAIAAGGPTQYLGGMITAPLVVVLSLAGMIQLVRHEGRARGIDEAEGR
jgi:hypothetical protein